MQCKPVFDFFLGALAPGGFTGWFAEAAACPGQTPWLIKAGPGCGKSTLMRRLLERDATNCLRDGSFAERLHCSSDPASLDGVRLSDAGALVLDATAPHTLDCVYPGVNERVISLYDTLNNDFLYQHRDEIRLLGRRHAWLMRQGTAHWALACAVLNRRRTLAAEMLDREKLDAFTRRLARRTMPHRPAVKPGRQEHRLLSAPTPEGLTIFYDTIPQLAHRTLYAIQDPRGMLSGIMLEQLAEYARHNGYDAYLCHCATDQRERLDHLFIPSLGLGFVTSNPWHPMQFASQRNIHASRFASASPNAAQRRLSAYHKRLADGLITRTCAAQSAAKSVHDALESYYVRAADFSAVDAVRQCVEAELFEG